MRDRLNILQKVRSDLEAWGVAPSFNEPMGPSAKCLSVEQVRSLTHGELETEQRAELSQHLRECNACSYFAETYNGATPEEMPQALYEQIGEILSEKRQTSESSGLSLAVWMSVGHKFRLAVATVVLLSLWVSYPYSAPYMQEAWSSSTAALNAYLEREQRRREELNLRQAALLNLGKLARVELSDPGEAQPLVEVVKEATIRGDISEPRQIATARTNLESNWKAAESRGEAMELWRDYAVELAGAETLVRYEWLRKSEGLNVVSLHNLGVTEISSDEGISRITFEGEQITDLSVKLLLQRSIGSPGIGQLEVYRGSTLLYTLPEQGDWD